MMAACRGELSLAEAAALIGEEKKVLDARERKLTVLNDELWRVLKDRVKRIELGNNELRSIAPLTSCTHITSIIAPNNQISELPDFSRLTELRLLDVRANCLRSLRFARDGAPPSLVSLIAAKNQIHHVRDVRKFAASLQTLVVAHNRIESLDGVEVLTQLRKLSASHNIVRTWPDTHALRWLVELRLNDNKLVDLPVDAVEGAVRLRLLDIGNNRLRTVDQLSALTKLRALRTLNVHVEKQCELGAKEGDPQWRKLVDGIRLMCPRIGVLNGKAIDTREKKAHAADTSFAERKPSNANGAAAADALTDDRGLWRAKQSKTVEKGSVADAETSSAADRIENSAHIARASASVNAEATCNTPSEMTTPMQAKRKASPFEEFCAAVRKPTMEVDAAAFSAQGEEMKARALHADESAHVLEHVSRKERESARRKKNDVSALQRFDAQDEHLFRGDNSSAWD